MDPIVIRRTDNLLPLLNKYNNQIIVSNIKYAM